MINNKQNDPLEKVIQTLVENCESVLKCYENYLLDKSDWRDLAKTMIKIKSSVNAYYSAGGK